MITTMKRKFTVKGQTYTANIEKDGKFYFVECLELDTYTQGKTIKDALKNIKEVTELYLEVFPMKRFTKAKGISFLGLKNVNVTDSSRS